MSAQDVLSALTRPPPPTGYTRPEWDGLVRRLIINLQLIVEWRLIEQITSTDVAAQRMSVHWGAFQCCKEIGEALGRGYPPEDAIRNFRFHYQQALDDFGGLVKTTADGLALSSTRGLS